jgi:altronate dehydratase small subunit
MKKAYQIHEKDNVATVLDDIEISDEVEIVSLQGGSLSKIKLKQKVISGHKLAITDCGKGEKIVKYGEIIGVASAHIAVGDWVHTHNVESDRMSIQTEGASS